MTSDVSPAASGDNRDGALTSGAAPGPASEVTSAVVARDSAAPVDWRAGLRQPVVILTGMMLISTVAKLWLAATTYGTNDVRYWRTFQDYVVQHGSVTVYRDIWYYN